NQTISLLILSGRAKNYPVIFGPISAHVYRRPLDERILMNITSKLHIETIKRCNIIVTITRQVKRLYSGVIDEEKIRVIPFAVNVDLFKPPENHFERDVYEILFAGYLYKLKGVEYLVRAMRLVLNERKNVKLLIAGDGPERARLIELAKKLGMKDKVAFLGAVPYNEMPKLYQRCDVFCLPTLGEPFGKTLIEAMACAKPVISTKRGGPSEIIEDGKNGFLVPPADPEAIARKILLLIEDDKTRKMIGETARRTAVERYSWEAVSQRYHELYRSLL
ncbi:MAG: glycosyltransferase family 4 protein, partial [Desulfurococcaceae archaeon]